MGSIRTVSTAVLSAALVLGVMSGGYEKLIYVDASNSTQTHSNKERPEKSSAKAEPKFMEVTDSSSLVMLKQKIFYKDNFIVTSEYKTKIFLEYYGESATNSSGEYPAEGEIFHALKLSYTDGETRNDEPLILSFDVDGETYTPELLQQGRSERVIISAPEEAEITFNVQTGDVKQSMNAKTGERTSKGIAEVWYGTFDGVVTPEKISKPIGENAKVDMAFSFAWKVLYDEQAGWADEGKQTWIQLQTHGNQLISEGYTVKDEINKTWLTDEKGTRYDLMNSQKIYDGAQLLFLVPADTQTLKVHTLHGGKIMNGTEVVEVIPETEINEAVITFPK